VFSANQPSCLALQTASVLKAAGGPGELDRLDISFTNTPFDLWGSSNGESSWKIRVPPVRLASGTESPEQVRLAAAEQFPWPQSRLEFSYAPNEGILQLDKARASRINLRTARVAVPLLPRDIPLQHLSSFGSLRSLLVRPGQLLSPVTSHVNVSLPCQLPVGLIQRGPWTARVGVAALEEGPQAQLTGPPHSQTRSWNSTFQPAAGCLPVEATCSMGTPLSALLLDLLGGHDTVALVAVTHAVSLATPGGDGPALPPPRSQVGYLWSKQSLRTYQLSHASEVKAFAISWDRVAVFKLGALISAVFILAATSVLVNFILSETQARMMRFTLALQRNMRTRRPLLPLIAAHSASSLVFVPIMLGVLFFLFEFFGDQLLAFCVLIFIWFCEVFGVVSVRTVGSLEVFPRVVFLLLLWFHVYYLTFPFGFHYVCLHTAVAGVACAVWHLWSRHELPALLSGRITHSHPRDEAVNNAIMRVMLGQGVHLSTNTPGVPRPPHDTQQRDRAATAPIPQLPSDRRVRYAATTTGGAGEARSTASPEVSLGSRGARLRRGGGQSSVLGAAASGGRQQGSEQDSARRRSHSDSEVVSELDARGSVRYDDDSEIPWSSRSSGTESERARGWAREAASAISQAERDNCTQEALDLQAVDVRAPHSSMPPSMAGGTGVTPQLIHEYFAPPTAPHRRAQTRPAGTT